MTLHSCKNVVKTCAFTGRQVAACSFPPTVTAAALGNPTGALLRSRHSLQLSSADLSPSSVPLNGRFSTRFGCSRRRATVVQRVSNVDWPEVDALALKLTS